MKKGYDIYKRAFAVLLITGLILMSFSACQLLPESASGTTDYGSAVEADGRSVKLYYTDSSLEELYNELYIFKNTGSKEKIDELIAALDKNPEAKGFRKAKPSEVEIYSYGFGDDGQFIVYFDENYYSMEPVEEILCRAAIVKSLCQLDEINMVEFYAGAQPLVINGSPTGLMDFADFVDKTGTSADFRQTVEIKVYLTDEKGKMLHESLLSVESDGSKTLEQLALEELIYGPLSTQTELRAVINPDTMINKVRTSDGTCYVDFDKSFLTKPGKVRDELVVYSVVNTLCELPDITKVKISVNGDEKRNLGNISLGDYLTLRPELISTEKAGEGG
ncbi:MAG: GerMN domain-containing protein [Lachnospiraceae bacterium]|nr:GerMN domain-containing protein [Lachnospiraceae bacterium]